jgi:uncharacterized protein (TIGR00290 family)
MKSVVCWSGGKDSVLALYQAKRMNGLNVVGLLTTLSREFDRVSMHGVHRALLEAQAKALGLPVRKVYVSTYPPDMPCARKEALARGFVSFPSNDLYEQAMLEAFFTLKQEGVEAVVFGDIFLEDLRAYRELLLARAGLKGIYPLWGSDTRVLLEEFIASGFRAVTSCVDARKLDKRWAGRALNAAFLRDLPEGVDPCGERGEYHTFVFDGPLFRRPVDVVLGETVYREPGFWFRDLLPAEELAEALSTSPRPKTLK